MVSLIKRYIRFLKILTEQLVRSERLYRWPTSVELKSKDQQNNLMSVYISHKGTM